MDSRINSKNNNTTKKTNYMKLLLLCLLVISFLPVFAQDDIENDTIGHVTIDFVGVEDHIISEILEIPGTNLQSNGTINLEITINNMIELEERLSECSVLDECEILLQIYNVLQSQEESNDERQFFIFLQILLPVVTGAFGLFLGHQLSEYSRIKRERIELEKIHRLISLDFSRIFNLEKNMKINHSNMRKDLQTPGIFSQFITNQKTLTVLMRYLKAGLKFYHWETLENSASLIKLEPDEIQKLQFAYDQISGVDDNNETAWLELAQVLESSLKQITNDLEREKFFRTQVNAYFESIFVGYNTVDVALKQLTMKWLDFELFLKEYPSEQEKVNQFISDKKG